MRHRNHDQLRRMFDDHDVVRKAFQDDSSGTRSSGSAGTPRKRYKLLFEKIDSGVERTEEVCAKARALLFVPCGRFNGFLGGVSQYPYRSHHSVPHATAHSLA